MFGSNFHRFQGGDRASFRALGGRLYGGKDRKAHEPFPNPYRTAVVYCNDRREHDRQHPGLRAPRISVWAISRSEEWCVQPLPDHSPAPCAMRHKKQRSTTPSGWRSLTQPPLGRAARKRNRVVCNRGNAKPGLASSKTTAATTFVSSVPPARKRVRPRATAAASRAMASSSETAQRAQMVTSPSTGTRVNGPPHPAKKRTAVLKAGAMSETGRTGGSGSSNVGARESATETEEPSQPCSSARLFYADPAR